MPDPLIFFGTPDFAVPTLARLVEAGMTPRLVVSQPARPVGRGGRLTDPPVAAWAKAHELEVVQPEKVREEAFLACLAALAPEVAVVVAFGQIFPKRLLALPRLGCLNVHASLLPKYRGAAPIQAAVAAGERETGVCVMAMEASLDTGPVYACTRTAIGEREMAPELAARLALLGAELLVETLPEIAAGSIEPRAQEHALATYAPRITKEDGRVDWALPAPVLWNRLKAYAEWPGQTASHRGAPLKLVWAEPEVGAATEAAPGTILGLENGRLRVACGSGTVLAVERVQRAGRAPIFAQDFANGARLAPGDRFE